MRFLLILYTTTILAWSTAEFLDDSPAYPKTDLRSENVKEGTRSLGRYFNDEANIKRPHINRRTGFDGKVRNINIEPNVNRPGIRAYGLPKTDLEDNGLIERINVAESVRGDEQSRNSRIVEAYGMSKKQLDDNGKIERIPPLAILKNDERNDDSLRRVSRSISEEPKDESKDLEAQDAKVFRPLFVYRQQVARRQKLNERKFYGKLSPEKKEKSSQIVSKLNKLIQSVILRSLDGLLMIAILPYVCYQWASRNERSLIILKAIVEITLELIMWFIFAGVSILITAAFLMEELYFNQNDNKDVKSRSLTTLEESRKADKKIKHLSLFFLNYKNEDFYPRGGQTFRRGPVRNVYHQNGFSQWNPQQYYPRQNYPQQNINVDESFATAEWICRNPTTGDMLIIASETKDQREETLDKSFQRNTNSHNIHSADEDLKKENDMKNHGGEGLIDVRVGV
ncbi:hypothetical protein HZH66_005503 [Vespula vulgaris]|uniref:Uncharacterized protein n=1 Tax=Vespula vulgaris TaxID=7454 RepID=A0A834K8H8_VESVU|nr:hypothetical protein HZH66_005503 [Vespula vulgaris]